MITSVEIQGLRGIRQGRLEELAPLVVLVGPNGSGKSTVLDALMIGGSPDPGEAVTAAAHGRRRGIRSARWLVWRGGEESSSTIRIETDENVSREITIEIFQPADRDGEVQLRWSAQTVLQPTGAVLEKVQNTIQFRNLGEPQRTRYHRPLEGVSELQLLDNLLSGAQQPLHQLFTRSVEKGRRAEIVGLVKDVVPGAIDVEILTDGDRPVLYIDYEDRGIPVELAGDGVQSLVRLSLELVTRPKGVVLLEEPEVHLHPGAIRQSARAIFGAVRRNIQAIITTHNLELIDALVGEARDDEELSKLCLYRLVLDKGVLLSSRVPGSEVAFARSEIGDDLR